MKTENISNTINKLLKKKKTHIKKPLQNSFSLGSLSDAQFSELYFKPVILYIQ